MDLPETTPVLPGSCLLKRSHSQGQGQGAGSPEPTFDCRAQRATWLKVAGEGCAPNTGTASQRLALGSGWGAESRIMERWGPRDGGQGPGTFCFTPSPPGAQTAMLWTRYGQVRPEGRAGMFSWFSFQRFPHPHHQSLKLAIAWWVLLYYSPCTEMHGEEQSHPPSSPGRLCVGGSWLWQDLERGM